MRTNSLGVGYREINSSNTKDSDVDTGSYYEPSSAMLAEGQRNKPTTDGNTIHNGNSSNNTRMDYIVDMIVNVVLLSILYSVLQVWLSYDDSECPVISS